MARKAKSGSIESKLLADVVANPDDDGPRIVYADKLVENDDPRGEFIQLQCALAKLSDDDPSAHRMRHRERALLKAHRDAWSAQVTAIADVDCDFVRGFIEGIGANVDTIATHAKKLIAVAPLVSRVRLGVLARTIAPFVKSPMFPRTVELVVRAAKGRIDLTSLAPLRDPVPLRSLVLDEVAIGREDVAAIIASKALSGLRTLVITDTRFGKESIVPLASLARPLAELTLQTTHAPADVVRAISTAPGLAKLAKLALANNPIGDDGLAAILHGDRLANVEHLDLRSNALSAAAIRELLAANLGPVRWLLLGGNEIDDDLVAAIAAWPGATRLEKLDLGSSKVGDAGVRAIAASPKLAKLRSLVLSSAKCGKAAEAALLASPYLERSRLYVGQRFLARS